MLGRLSQASWDIEQPLGQEDARRVLSVVRIKITSRHCRVFLKVVTLVDNSDREPPLKNSKPYQMFLAMGMAEAHRQRGEVGP